MKYVIDYLQNKRRTLCEISTVMFSNNSNSDKSIIANDKMIIIT